jgi:hypothetical protein
MNTLKKDEVEKSAGNLCACKLLSFFFFFQLGQLLAQGVVRISGGHQKHFSFAPFISNFRH